MHKSPKVLVFTGFTRGIVLFYELKREQKNNILEGQITKLY